MNIVAVAKNVRGSARKARIPAEVVKGMLVEEALPVLKYIEKSAAKDVWKVINSAKSNAIHNYGVAPENLVIENIRVDKGMRLRRYKAGSRGMARPIHKHFCHITVELRDLSKPESKEQVQVKSINEKKEKSQGKKSVKSETKIENKKQTKKIDGKGVKKTAKSTKKADK
ncbi:MAG: hypothetical protein Kow0081_2810 [Candidatus Dojkabacteria bacterium]